MTEASQDSTVAWDRLLRETAKAYQAAQLYFEMGAKRSLRAVAQHLRKHVSLIERWSRAWSWVQRASDFDHHVARQQQEAYIAERRKQQAKWVQRRAERSEQQYQLGRKIEEKVEKMISYPLTSVTQADGRTTIQPAKWKFSDVAKLATAAANLINTAIEKEVGDSEHEREEEWIIEDYIEKD